MAKPGRKSNAERAAAATALQIATPAPAAPVALLLPVMLPPDVATLLQGLTPDQVRRIVMTGARAELAKVK